jgi:hypothetical protein
VNKFEALVSESAIAVIVAGSPTLDRFMFLPLDSPTDDAATAAAKCGLVFVGCVGLGKDFVPRSAFALELSLESINAIAEGFITLCERAIVHLDGTRWLTQLYSLPDEREN